MRGYERRQWRHLDTCQFRTIIEAQVPRVLDPGTGKTQMVAVPWAGRRSSWTLVFEYFVIRVLLGSATISDALKLTGLQLAAGPTDHMTRAVDRGLQRRRLEEVGYVGLDEKSFRRGQDYILVMTDLVAGGCWKCNRDATSRPCCSSGRCCRQKRAKGCVRPRWTLARPTTAATRQAAP